MPKPNISKKDAKAKIKREQDHKAAVEAALANGEDAPELPAGLGGDITVKFLHYPEIHPNINHSQVRPCWVIRNGEWFWRMSGGVLQYLTNRLSDGKSSSGEGKMVKPMLRKTFVPSGVNLNLLLSSEENKWVLEAADAPQTEESRQHAKWLACVTLVPAVTDDAEPAAESSKAKGKRKSGDGGGGEVKPLVAHSGHARKILGSVEEEEPSPSSRFEIGQVVEALQEDEGFEGSYYTADLLEISDETNKAKVRYHAFDEETVPGAKLTDWVELRRIRPLPPPTPSDYLKSLTPGKPIEMRFEDGWWLCTLILVGEKDFLPPIVEPSSIKLNEKIPGLDKKSWRAVKGGEEEEQLVLQVGRHMGVRRRADSQMAVQEAG